MKGKIIHAALINQECRPRLWLDLPDFETIPVMASKEESAESTAQVAERLRLTREAFGMKKAAWCRFVGISPQAWSNVEGTKATPAMNRISLDQAMLVCRATGVGLNWIYRGNPDDMPVKVALAMKKLEAANRRKVS